MYWGFEPVNPKKHHETLERWFANFLGARHISEPPRPTIIMFNIFVI